MVIEPPSLIFFRVPSCAAAGTARARARAARISVIGRACRSPRGQFESAAGWVGRLHDSTGAGVDRATAKPPGGLEFGLEPPEGARHEPGADAHRARSPGRPGVPADAYYGIHTLRALENFRITGTASLIYPDLVRALACVKQAAALANNALGLLPDGNAGAIVRACEEIREGGLLDQFVVDVIQGGAGTSTNMNANEVIANRGLELLGHARGEYRHLAPVEDVNHEPEHQRRYPRQSRWRCISLSTASAQRCRSCAAPSTPRRRSSPRAEDGRERSSRTPCR